MVHFAPPADQSTPPRWTKADITPYFRDVQISPVRAAAAISAAIAVIAASGCSGTAAVQGASVAAVPIVTAKAQLSDFPIELRVPAVVEPHLTVTVKAQVAGELRRALVYEGQAVHRAEVLFEIEPEPYIAALNQAKAQMERDQAQLQLAQANLGRDQAQARTARNQAERYSRLASEGIASREQAEQFRTSAETADQSVSADEAALAVASAAIAVDKAAAERAQVDLDHCTIRSPIDGIAGYLAIHQGNIVKANADTALITINEIAPAFVSFAVPDHFLDQVRRRLAGGPLPLRVYEPESDRELSTGAVDLLDNAVDSATGTICVKGLVLNSDSRLWSGESVEAVLTLGIQHGVVTIPKAAVQQGEHGWYAFAVNRDSKAELRTIRTGAENETTVVISDGIRAGEDVVIDGQLRLRPGARVRAVVAPGGPQ